ncbi:MAG: hypothetical protein ABSB95_13115 [Dissulfurispiraceae bacterium]|jgi:hypothetical protein
MKFSIETKPPAKTEILNQEIELQKKIKKNKYFQKTFFFWTFMLFIFGFVAIFGPLFSKVAAIESGLIIFIASFIMGFSSFILAGRTDSMNSSLKELSDIPKNCCEEALMICRINAECERYRQDVISLGRKIAYGELVMIRKLVPTSSEAYNEGREKRLEWACRKLHS